MYSTQFDHMLQQNVGAVYRVSLCAMSLIDRVLVIFIDALFLGYENSHYSLSRYNTGIKLLVYNSSDDVKFISNVPDIQKQP